MSIETEKWDDDGSCDGVVDQNGNPVCEVHGSAERRSRRHRAIVVLPEALALLKRLDRRGGLGLEEHEAIRDVLGRAGVAL